MTENNYNVVLTEHSFRLADSLDDESNKEVMSVATGLLHKMVPLDKPLQLTLLGLSVSEMIKQDGGISSFFAAKQTKPSERCQVSPQSPTKADKRKPHETDNRPTPVDKVEEKLPADGAVVDGSSSISPDDYKKYSSGIDPAVFSELPPDIQAEIVSVNKQAYMSRKRKASGDGAQCPDGWDPEVFRNLPNDIKTELLNSKQASQSNTKPRKSGQNTITKFFKKM